MPERKNSKKRGGFKGAQERRERVKEQGGRNQVEYELVEGRYGGLEIRKHEIDADRRKREKEEARKELEARKKRKEQNLEQAREAAASRVSYVRKPVARRSFFSVGMLVVALLLGFAGIYWAVATKGQAPMTSAAMVFCSFISFLEEGRNYVLARICIAASTMLMAAWAVTIFIGVRG